MYCLSFPGELAPVIHSATPVVCFFCSRTPPRPVDDFEMCACCHSLPCLRCVKRDAETGSARCPWCANHCFSPAWTDHGTPCVLCSRYIHYTHMRRLVSAVEKNKPDMWVCIDCRPLRERAVRMILERGAITTRALEYPANKLDSSTTIRRDVPSRIPSYR